MNIFDMHIKEALVRIKNKDVVVQGQYKGIDKYFKIWKGNPSWLSYRVHLPNGDYRTESMHSLNLPKYFASTWANNYANEGLEITIPNEDSNDRLQEILSVNQFKAKFNLFADGMMALGAGAIIVNASSFNVNDKNQVLVADNSDVTISFIDGMRVIPVTVFDGEIVECAFVKYMTNGVTLIIHYLRDDGYYSIAEIEAIGFDGTYTFDYSKMKIFDTNSNIPLFTYWHPNKAVSDNVLPTSIFDGAEDALAQCDLAYESLWKEIKLGKKKQFMSDKMQRIDYDKDGNPISANDYDLNDESLYILPEGEDGRTLLQEFNGELRVHQILQDLNANMNLAAMLVGLGQSQFEFDGQSGRPIQTATGVIAKQTELYRNVIKQENFAEAQLKRIVKAIMFVNNNWTNQPKITECKVSEIIVTFDDNIMEDTSSKKEQELKEVSAGIMTVAEYRTHWYGQSLDEATQFIQDNGLLIDKYLLAWQAGALSDEVFIDLVFGKEYANRNELLTYLKEHNQIPMDLEPEE